MAECLENSIESKPNWILNDQNLKEQIDEISALKSFYENTNILDVLEEASAEDNKKYAIQVKLPIITTTKPLQIEIWLPLDKTDLSDDSACSSKQPVLERSLSGKRAHTVLNCDYLPPIEMTVILPDSYPSETKPHYVLSSFFLSQYQLSKLSSQLDEIWVNNFNMPVLYTWFEWLQNNLVEFLDIFEKPNSIIITPLNDGEQLVKNDCISSTFQDGQDLIFQILRYNFIQELKEFRNTMQNCLICFDEKLGSEFYRLDDCKHHFCAECMTSMCRIHVKEGTIQLLKCPDKDCKEFVPMDIMTGVLTNEEFERWERLMLQRTLDSMSDVMYCPKCSNPIIIEENNTHAYCMECKVDFCKLCKESWHSGQCLTGEEKINNRVKKLNLNADELLKLTDEQIRARFKDAKFVLELKQKTVAAIGEDAVEKMLRKYVACPKCRAPIDKFEGCNKVTCICGCILCYICGKVINGYEHFNDNKCNLYTNTMTLRVIERPRHQAQVAVERILNLVPEQRRNAINCPTCGQISLKSDKNNHIKCWLCTTNICFCCKKRIIGNVSAHYKQIDRYTCKQHSDE